MSMIEAQFYSFFALKFLRNSLKLGSRLAMFLILALSDYPGSDFCVCTKVCSFLISAMVFGLEASFLAAGFFLLPKNNIRDS